MLKKKKEKISSEKMNNEKKNTERTRTKNDFARRAKEYAKSKTIAKRRRKREANEKRRE